MQLLAARAGPIPMMALATTCRTVPVSGVLALVLIVPVASAACVARGQRCHTVDDQCDEGSDCQQYSGTQHGTCTPLIGIGGASGSACEAADECLLGYLCQGFTIGPPHCEETHAF